MFRVVRAEFSVAGNCVVFTARIRNAASWDDPAHTSAHVSLTEQSPRKPAQPFFVVRFWVQLNNSKPPSGGFAGGPVSSSTTLNNLVPQRYTWLLSNPALFSPTQLEVIFLQHLLFCWKDAKFLAESRMFSDSGELLARNIPLSTVYTNPTNQRSWVFEAIPANRIFILAYM